MNILISYIIASLIVSLIFGIQLLITLLVNKINANINMSKYLFQLLFMVAFIVLYGLFPLRGRLLNFQNFIEPINFVLFVVAVVPISYLIARKRAVAHKLLEWVLLGISMEVPQRLFMQNLFYVLLVTFSATHCHWISIVLNALIWAQFIVVQEKIAGNKLSKDVLCDALSSIWFSLAVGLLYEISGNILLPMAAHGCERLLSEILRKRMGNQITQND